MRCRSPFSAKIELAAVHALDGWEAARFEAHLEGCASCSAELGRLYEAIASLIPDTAPPAEVWARIEDAIGSSHS